ncbi:hypothetical protein PBAC_23050 [Pedobacter glucosidilyticus]|uniref:Uncharacterized protein n=1 Tax=Pedobacter aquae TaxID=2605747 RepID=A0A5C0VDU0_9SPHI|nr:MULTISPECIES: hypothetical protein [Pedobacter]KHJ37461.1 hypothetical protein PBAC_23050 [Pedobacter glucosidilyticus]QEK50848.1 hypothetical protein FYC62_03560 [Pedobacter aquae]
MNFSTKRILLSSIAVILLVSSVLAGIHPFINQKKNYTTQNTSLTLVKKDSSVVKKATTAAKPKEVKKETPSSNYFKDFISFSSDEKEEQEENNNSFSLFPLLKEGFKVILNQMRK